MIDERSLSVRRAGLTVVTVIALVSGVLFATRPEAARPRATRHVSVSCGSTIVVNGEDEVHITNSLTGCPGDGLIITGEAKRYSFSNNGWPRPGPLIGGHLYFDGNTISGLGAGTGIVNNSEIVSIENGGVSGFGTCIQNTRDALIQRFRVSACTTGIGASSGGEGHPGAGTSLIDDVVFGNTSDGTNLLGTSAYVSGGTFSGNGGVGIGLSTQSALVRHATSVSNATGISLAHPGQIYDSLANSNSGNGIVLNDVARAEGNEADFNGGFGMTSVPGTTGLNRAKGNATAAQCRNVACS